MKRNAIVCTVFALSVILTAASYVFWDIELAYYCRGLHRSLLDVAEVVTVFGEAKWYYVPIVCGFVVFRFILKNPLWSRRFLFLLAALSASGLINMLWKWLAGRHRPVNLFQKGLFGFDFFQIGYEWNSFPSGHAVTAFSLAMAAGILFPHWRIPAFAAAAAVALSRVVITSHYLSDIIAGAGWGIICTLIVGQLFDRWTAGVSPAGKAD